MTAIAALIDSDPQTKDAFVRAMDKHCETYYDNPAGRANVGDLECCWRACHSAPISRAESGSRVVWVLGHIDAADTPRQIHIGGTVSRLSHAIWHAEPYTRDTMLELVGGLPAGSLFGRRLQKDLLVSRFRSLTRLPVDAKDRNPDRWRHRSPTDSERRSWRRPACAIWAPRGRRRASTIVSTILIMKAGARCGTNATRRRLSPAT